MEQQIDKDYYFQFGDISGHIVHPKNFYKNISFDNDKIQEIFNQFIIKYKILNNDED